MLALALAVCCCLYLPKPLLLQIEQPLFPDVLLHVGDASSRLPFLLTSSSRLLPDSLTPSAPGSPGSMPVLSLLLQSLLFLFGPPSVPPCPLVLCSSSSSFLFFFCFRLFYFFSGASPSTSFPPVCVLMIPSYSVGLPSPAAVVHLFGGSELPVMQGNIELACISCLLTLATCNAEVVV